MFFRILVFALFNLFIFSKALASNTVQPDDFKVDDDTRVVTFGEVHDVPSLHTVMFEYVDLITAADSSFDCFFVEFDSTAKEKIDRYMAGDLSYEESILPFSEGRLNLLPKSLAENLKERRFNVFPVDFEYKSEKGNWYFANSGSGKIFVEDRSSLMTQNILTLLESDQCQKGIFLVGQVHIWKHAFDDGRLVRTQTVQEFFDDLDVPTKTFLLHNNELNRGVTLVR